MIAVVVQPTVQIMMCASAYQNPQLMIPVPQMDALCCKGINVALLNPKLDTAEQNATPSIIPFIAYGTWADMNSRPPMIISVRDKT